MISDVWVSTVRCIIDAISITTSRRISGNNSVKISNSYPITKGIKLVIEYSRARENNRNYLRKTKLSEITRIFINVIIWHLM